MLWGTAEDGDYIFVTSQKVLTASFKDTVSEPGLCVFLRISGLSVLILL